MRTPKITCKRQRNAKLSLEWCDYSQYQDRCKGCRHNEGRATSKYQQDKQKTKEVN